MESIVAFDIQAKSKDIGDNFIVRRSLPHFGKPMVGPFIFWDHMGPVEIEGEREMKVRAHPHIGLATITYLFSGSIMHRDSLGNEQSILPGEINWMTAGSGIVHSERSKATKGQKISLEGIQLWVALPKEYESIEPSFVHIKQDQVPKVVLGDVEALLIAGSTNSISSPIPVYSSLFYGFAKAKSGQNFQMSIGENVEAAIYILSGCIDVGGNLYQGTRLVIFKTGEDLEFQLKENTEFMFFGGEIFPEKRHIWWNFVSSSPDLIEEAKRKWKEGEFPSVINESERIPLPEK